MRASKAAPSPGTLYLLGHPVSHSLSPVFQNAALRAAGIDATYVARDVDPADLATVLAAIKAENGAGNVTIPHKERIAELCDVRTALSERTRAVNTFRVVDGVLEGDNTDIGGFHNAMLELLGREPGNERVALIGAGGAAAGVLAAIESWPGSSASVYSRGHSRAVALVQRFRTVAKDARSLADAARDATIIVNATPIGLRDDNVPIAAEHLPRGAHVLDLVYRPGETRLVQQARQLGLRAADGRVMLLEQGALAFEQWFGYAPDKMVMRRALDAAMIGV